MTRELKKYWESTAKELTDLGVPTTPEELAQPAWCIKKLAELGYSISITSVTLESYLEQVKRIGKVEVDSPFVQGIAEEIREVGVLFSYSLLGGEYINRGDHSVPLTDSLELCTSVALWNAVRLREDKNKTKTLN